MRPPIPLALAAGAAASAGDASAGATGVLAVALLRGAGTRLRSAHCGERAAHAVRESARSRRGPRSTFLRTFPGEFERAFADRFGGRDALVLLHHRALVGVFGVSPAPNVMIGRDGWLYFLGEDGQALDRHYRGTLPIGDAEIAAVAAELVRRRGSSRRVALPTS